VDDASGSSSDSGAAESSSTGEACVPAGEACAEGQAECCEGSQCVAQGDALACVPCGVEGDPCQPNGGANGGCCGQLNCVQGIGGLNCG
jgi:hypothetical protein